MVSSAMAVAVATIEKIPQLVTAISSFGAHTSSLNLTRAHSIPATRESDTITPTVPLQLPESSRRKKPSCPILYSSIPLLERVLVQF